MLKQADSTPKLYHDFMLELKWLVSRWEGKLTPEDLMIISAQFVGNMAALVPEPTDIDVMATIVENVKLGNKQGLLQLDKLGKVG